jgi:hypothetical protein
VYFLAPVSSIRLGTVKLRKQKYGARVKKELINDLKRSSDKRKKEMFMKVFC